MITSAENRAWPNDVPLGADYAASGLPAPSLVRPSKIATVDVGRVELLGRLPDGLLDKVGDAIAVILGRAG